MLLSKLANEGAVKFLRTVTIKNAYFADQMLKYLVNERFRNGLPEELNPYYIHITGNYVLGDAVEEKVKDPVSDTEVTLNYGCISTVYDPTGKKMSVPNRLLYTGFDEMMYVTSLDTRTTVPFTREVLHGIKTVSEDGTEIYTLNAHEKTLEAYKVGSKYYKRLCERYPNQVDLIKSIVYFAPDSKNPMGFAIGAPHLSMISYDASLLEDRERVNVLDAINGFLDLVKDRWDTREYTYEDHYAGALWSIIWSILPMLIAVQRYSNIKTPFVHSSHLWDYLTSNGLESFKGYLSQEQEWFLYKNIRYLRDRSGQHRILNILIDNLLSDYNLTIESKNVALHKEGILGSVSIADTTPDSQCKMCARASICAKKNTEYTCNLFVGTKDTLKPKPVVLSETLSGARKERVIHILMERESISEEEAKRRYDNSFMWHDQAIESIVSELDRNQTVVLNGATETVDQLVKREFDSGLEPVYNEGIVEEQSNELRHARMTVIPTKVLEILETAKSVKYTSLFARFITDTFLCLAQRDNVTTTYSVQIGQDAVPFTFGFKEAVAALYLGCVYLYLYNTQVDEVEGVGTPDRKYLTKFFSDLINDPNYDIPIPNRAIIGSAFKQGRAVTQEALYDAYTHKDEPAHKVDKEDSLREMAGLVGTDDVAIVNVNGITYAVRNVGLGEEIVGSETVLIEPWLGYDLRLEVVGWFCHGQYTVNNDSCAILPTYFKWNHPTDVVIDVPTQDVEAGKSTPTKNTVKQLAVYEAKDGLIVAAGPQNTTLANIHRLRDFIDVDYIVENYSEIVHTTRNQSVLGKYYTDMFNIMERCMIVDSNANESRQHAAVEAVIDACIIRKTVNFSLIGTATDNISTYADWFDSIGIDVGASFRRLLLADDSALLWDEFCVKLLGELLEGCESPYASTGAEKNRYNRLRELVASLSSYLVSFIDTKESTDSFSSSNSVRTDIQTVDIKSSVNLHFEAAGEQLRGIPPHSANEDSDLRTLLGISTDQYLDVLHFNGEWRYRTGKEMRISELVPAYPGEYSDYSGNEIIRKDVTNEVHVAGTLEVMGYDKTKRVYEYYKTIERSDIVWDQEEWESCLTSQELTDYMNNKICKIKWTTTSNVIIDLAESKLVEA